MKSILLLTATTFFVLITLNANAASAGTSIVAPNSTATAPKNLVTAIDASAGTIQLQMKDMSTHSYKIDANTHIFVGGHPVKSDKIHAGMVVVNFAERGDQILDRIVLHPPPSAPAPPSSR